jgi:hypothetical protein
MVIGAIPEVLRVHPKVGAGTVAELIAFADTVCDNLEGSLAPCARES